MTSLLGPVESLFPLLWRATWQASILILLVLLVQTLLQRPLSARFRHALWLLVLLRLALPITPECRLSLFNFTPSPAPLLSPSLPLSSPPLHAIPASLPASTPIPTPPLASLLPHLLALAYLLGILVLLSRTLLATLRLHLQLRHFSRVTDPSTLALFDACRHTLSVRRPIPIYTHPTLSTPALMGYFRPRLLLPASLPQAFSAHELRLVFLHELVHLKRHDVAINYWLTILQTLHWFNPLVWLAFHRLRLDRELATDEQVLSVAHPADRSLYGHAILKLLQTLSPSPLPVPGSVGILESRHALTRRITMIARFSRKPLWLFIPLGALALVLGLSALTDAVTHAAATTAPAESVSPPAPASSPEIAKTQAALEQALAKPMTLSIDQQPAEKFFGFLRDSADINLHVDWLAIESTGMPRTTPISLKITKPVSLETLLQLAFRQLPNLGYYAKDGVLIITAQGNIGASNIILKTYDVADLLEPEKPLAPSSPGSVPAGASSQSGSTSQDASAPPPGGPGEKIKQLILVLETVSPDSWRDNGGTIGSIAPFNQKLVIKTTPAIHKEINDLLTQLRNKTK